MATYPDPQTVWEQEYMRIVQTRDGYAFERRYTDSLGDPSWHRIFSNTEEHDDMLKAVLDHHYRK